MKRIIILLFILIIQELHAAEVGGHVKTFITHYDANAIGRSDTSFNIDLRLDVREYYGDSIIADIAYEVSPIVRRTTVTAESPLILPHPSQYRIVDLDADLVTTKKDFALRQNLDRLMVSWSSPTSDIYIGRQPLAFGVARAINPTDIITPFAFDTIDQENRIGVDAIRVIVPHGSLGELDMGIIAGSHCEAKKSALFIKNRWHHSKSDYTATTIYFKKNFLAGINIQSSLYQAGTWLEAAYAIAGYKEESIKRSNWFRVSMGIDYNLTNDLYLYGEYHLSSAGTNCFRDFSSNVKQTAYRQGAVYLLGKHYFIPGMTYALTPLTTINAQIVANIVDLSCALNGTVEYNAGSNTYVAAGILQTVGHPSSEFSYYPNRIYIALKHYF